MMEWPTFDNIDDYTPSELKSEQPDFHATFSIQLCELAYYGFFDLSREDWDFDKYDQEQHERLCKKIAARYWFREIALTPPGIWKHEFIRKMNEIMPKYIPLYRALDQDPTLFATNSEYYKARNIYSEFPQTQLNGTNGDYASTGNDTEYERLHQMNTLDLNERLQEYEDVDAQILDAIEVLFSPLITVSINGY